ncbi:hypothetical protein D5086_021630 [Populus alba]|uniref:Uncharacterized protein n=1 Tax=Populus alba TaxID=43335 RepID=A0ACC4BDC3_POPAL
MGRKKKVINKDESAEGCCFVCKDGGTLRVCDYKDCLKAYHPICVEKNDNFLESEVPWSCNWHSCFICKKTATFNCLCCPNAVCGCCLSDANLAIIKAKGGFCYHCLTLAGILEGVIDLNEPKVNLSLQDSYEFLFKYYWEYIKEKEGVTSEHVKYANYLLNDNRNYDSNLSDNYVEEGEGLSDFEDQLTMTYRLNDVKEHKPSHSRKRSKGKPYIAKRKERSKTKMFLGWGSKCLFEFLTSIGQETNKELSQHDVTIIIFGYCRDNNLLDPLKRKKILCDEKLCSLLGRKFVNKNSIYKLLTKHFAENLEESRNEFVNSLEVEGQNALSPCKRQKNSSWEGKSQNKEVVSDMQRSCFASVIPRNIKLVYLRRSALEELSKQPEIFDAIVMGSFVRAKTDPNDWMQKNSHQLMQVIGIKKTLINGEVNSVILLQLSNRVSDVPISKVSENDFSEEECQDLHQRVKDGLLRRPNVVSFSIVKKLLLQTPVEQTRLLQEVPEVIADEIEVQSACKDMSRKDEQTELPKSALKGTSPPPKRSSEGIIKGSSCCLDDGANGAAEKKQFGVFEKLQHQSRTPTRDGKDGGFIQTGSKQYFEELNKNRSRVSQPKIVSGQTPGPFSEGMPSAFLPLKQCQPVNSISRDEQNELVDIECQNKEQSTPRDGSNEPSEPRFKLILSSDNGEQDPSAAANHTDKQHLKGAALEVNHQLHSLLDDTQDGGTLRTERNEGCQIKHTNTRAVHAEAFTAKVIASISQGRPNALPQEPYQPANDISKTKTNGQVNVAHENKKQIAPAADLIVLSDDEKEDASAAASKQNIQNLNCSIWNCISPNGMKTGPWSMLLLKEWSDSDSCVLKWKVWKSGRSPEDAIFLNDALHQVFNRRKC